MIAKKLREIQFIVVLFIIGIVVSGVTAFPIQTGINALAEYRHHFPAAMEQWILILQDGINETWNRYPFLAYGTDWLAFAHIMIGIAFIGVYKHPVRNQWVVHWAMICCVCVIPTAFICGWVRGIPFFHILIDCSFGVFGLALLLLLQHKITHFKHHIHR